MLDFDTRQANFYSLSLQKFQIKILVPTRQKVDSEKNCDRIAKKFISSWSRSYKNLSFVPTHPSPLQKVSPILNWNDETPDGMHTERNTRGR